MADCLTPDAVTQFAAKDVNRIVGRIGEVLALRSPFINILNGGTLSNVSDVVRSVVQERAVMGGSLAKPDFQTDVTLCNTSGVQDQVGSTEYSYALESFRGRGPRVCVKTDRTSFRGSYIQAQMSLEKGILQLTNADIRHTLFRRAGVKYMTSTQNSFQASLTGDAQLIDTLFAQFLPDAPLSFKTLYRLMTFMREEMLCDPFETEDGTFFKFIGSADQIEIFREELDVREDLRALTTGRFKLGERSIDGYTFTGPYRSVAFGIDQQPLRFNDFGGDAFPNVIEPEVSVVTSNGVAARRNPDWVNAIYEIGFLVCADSFERLVPEAFVGEGSFQFAPQLYGGELEWVYIRDNDCNLFGDTGQHVYQISRAYRPFRPHAVMPIGYKRCAFDLGLISCVSSVSGL